MEHIFLGDESYLGPPRSTHGGFTRVLLGRIDDDKGSSRLLHIVEKLRRI
jgi:hypothetical protein